jgi:phosphoenolpyruvate synthase/pyruvate phosphate dikinase
MEARRDGYRIEPRAQAPAGWRPAAKQAKARLLSAPDLRRRQPLPLAQMRLKDMSACGGKAARLGELQWLHAQGRLAGTAPVPDGFCIPYGAFAAFMAQPEVKARVAAALSEGGFEGSAGQRRAVLARLREDLLAMPLPAGLEAQWEQQWVHQLGRAGVFVRSSSNSEDLANFSGAGLYSTVPNVRADLARAVKTVWASVWNAEAFEARRQAGLRHEQVQMAVFVQKAVDSRMSGVMITRDPFDATRSGVVYVSAKRGIGIKVVEGKRIAEQALYDERSGAIERLSSSAESTELRLDETGGLKEVAVASAMVLQDAQVLALSRLALAIRRELGGAEQDIEWAIDGDGRLVMLQARPFVQRSAY